MDIKKISLVVGTMSAVVAPLATVVACGGGSGSSDMSSSTTTTTTTNTKVPLAHTYKYDFTKREGLDEYNYDVNDGHILPSTEITIK